MHPANDLLIQKSHVKWKKNLEIPQFSYCNEMNKRIRNQLKKNHSNKMI